MEEKIKFALLRGKIMFKVIGYMQFIVLVSFMLVASLLATEVITTDWMWLFQTLAVAMAAISLAGIALASWGYIEPITPNDPRARAKVYATTYICARAFNLHKRADLLYKNSSIGLIT